MNLEQLAREMYEGQENRVIPPWDSLTGGTRELWLDRAHDAYVERQLEQQQYGDLA